jgi:DNA-binding GntR family transcriptional regulator
MTHRRLATAAYSEVRAAVVDGRLAAGSIVVEADLAASLGISRTPIRQALRRLELEGYLQRDERGRLLVHGLTRKEVEDLFAVRQLLEGYGARLAAERISDAELERLEELLLADVDANRRGDAEELAVSNEQLHDLVLDASRNRTLVTVVRELRGRVYGLNAFAVGGAVHRHQFLEDHTQLVRLLREGDGIAAERLMHEHLGTAIEALAEGLSGRGGAAGQPV